MTEHDPPFPPKPAGDLLGRPGSLALLLHAPCHRGSDAACSAQGMRSSPAVHRRPVCGSWTIDEDGGNDLRRILSEFSANGGTIAFQLTGDLAVRVARTCEHTDLKTFLFGDMVGWHREGTDG